MNQLPPAANHIQYVSSFEELVSTPFQGCINAICWSREVPGGMDELVSRIPLTENLTVLDEADLCALDLSAQGKLARNWIVNDLKLLKAQQAAPTLNLIRCYDSDDTNSLFPTDVYSFHADRSPVPADTFLCTYYGAPSELVPNEHAIQKVLVPSIRKALHQQYDGTEDGFESYLSKHFFDLHYQVATDATIISLGVGQLWKLAVDYPGSKVLPCIHRAPHEQSALRLLLIC